MFTKCNGSQVTPYHLASWGFVCVSEDTFACSMCEQRVCATNLPFPSEAEEVIDEGEEKASYVVDE